MDTDYDRLAMIKSLGGQVVSAPSGTLTAIFEKNYLGDSVGELDIESRTPALTCRTSDVLALGLRKGHPVTVGADTYRIRRHEPDGTGISALVLES